MKKLLVLLCVFLLLSQSAQAQIEVPVLADAPGNPQVMMFIDDSGSMNAIMEHPEFDATSSVATNTANDIPSIIFRNESGASAPTTAQTLRPVLIEVNSRFYNVSTGQLYSTGTIGTATSMTVVANVSCSNTSGGTTNCPTPGPTTPTTGSNALYLFGNNTIYGASIFSTSNLSKYSGSTVTDSSGHEYLNVSYKKEDYERTVDNWGDVWAKLDTSGNPLTLHTRVYTTTGGTVKFNNKEVFLAAGWYRIEYLRWIFYGATSQQLANLPGKNRITTVKDVVKTLINNNPSVKWGLATLNGTSLTAGTYSGSLYTQWAQPLGSISNTLPIIRKDIGTANATLISSVNAIGAGGGTPLTNRYIEILRYFHGETDNDANASRTYPSPMTGPTAACDGYFIIMLTDGLPTAETKNSVFGAYISDFDGDGAEAPATSNGTCTTDATCSQWLDDAAYFAYHTDFNTTLTGTQNIRSYAVGLGVVYTLLDNFANDGGTGASYLANSVSEISDTLTNIVTLIITSPIAGAGAALAETFGETGIVYRPRFRADTWIGNIDVFHYNSSSGQLELQFDMGTLLEDRDISTSPRKIIAGYDPDGDGATSSTVNFDTSNATTLRPLLFSRFISGAESTSLLEPPLSNTALDSSAELLIRFVLGESIEDLRVRDRDLNGKVDRLGDIVYSRPIEVGPKNGNYNLLTGYAAFTRNLAASQPRILLVGANDGMVHCFNSTTGEELWAYIPSSQIPYLERQTRITYNSEYRRSYVDGPITVEDVYVGGSWKTYAMFGLRKGGSTYGVLDITDRSNPTLVWEVSNSSSAGESWTKPVVVPYGTGGNPATYTWNMVVGTGENKATAGTNILAYNLASSSPPSPTVVSISAIDPIGTRTSGVVAVQDDQDLAADRLYVGTEEGDLFRLNVAGAPATWGATVTKVYDGANTQPIVAQPLAVLTDNPRYVSGGTGIQGEQYAVGVYFGTGRYDTTADITTMTSNAQRIVGIFDPVRPTNDTYVNMVSALTTANLQNQTPASYSVTKGTDGIYRVPNTKNGFYIDLATSVTLASGNYINPVGLVQYEAVNLRGALFFSTFLPDNSACGVGGHSFLEGVNFRTGGGTIVDYSRDPKRPFYNGGLPDIDGNSSINSTDLTQGYNNGQLLPFLDAHVESVDLTKTKPYTYDGLLKTNDVRLHTTNGGIVPSVSSLGNVGAPNPPVISQSIQRVIIQSAYPSGTTLGNAGGGSGGSGGGSSGGSTAVPPPDMVPISIYNLPIDILSFHEITGE